MKTYTETVLSSRDVATFRQIEQLVGAFTELDLGSKRGEPITLSCHHLAHALAELFFLKAADGYSPRRGYQHSWLETESGNIIDVYPVGMVGGPLLLAARRFPDPWRPLYIDHPFDFIETPEFAREVSIVKQLLVTIAQKLDIELCVSAAST